MKVYQYANRSKQHPNWLNNWGDAFCADMMSKLSGIDYQVTDQFTDNGKILAAGSVMKATKSNDIVWGTGCIMPKMIGSKPAKVLAVRGPLTRQELLAKHIACPEVYGDPALLMPLVFSPTVSTQTHEWGLIPHYIDHEDPIVDKARQMGIKIIDICQPTASLINEMHSVKKIMSSSLHGLILADAYGIPNVRVTITGKLVGKDFKFEDYYKSVDRREIKTYNLTNVPSLNKLSGLKLNDKIDFNSDLLLSVAPWVDII